MLHDPPRYALQPDHFKNCRLPETPINDKLAFGFSVPGTHNFPTQFFEAKYVITCEPFPQTYVGSGEMSIKLNDRFLAVRDQYFAFEKALTWATAPPLPSGSAPLPPPGRKWSII